MAMATRTVHRAKDRAHGRRARRTTTQTTPAQAAHDKLMRDLIHQPSPPPAPFVEQPATEADHG
jgi:hypothetical protein